MKTNDDQNKYFMAEKSSEDARWSMSLKSSVEEAKAYIGSCQHWRITNIQDKKVLGQSKDLPYIFDKGCETKQLVEGAARAIHLKTTTQTKERLVNA